MPALRGPSCAAFLSAILPGFGMIQQPEPASYWSVRPARAPDLGEPSGWKISRRKDFGSHGSPMSASTCPCASASMACNCSVPKSAGAPTPRLAARSANRCISLCSSTFSNKQTHLGNPGRGRNRSSTPRRQGVSPLRFKQVSDHRLTCGRVLQAAERHARARHSPLRCNQPALKRNGIPDQAGFAQRRAVSVPRQAACLPARYSRKRGAKHSLSWRGRMTPGTCCERRRRRARSCLGPTRRCQAGSTDKRCGEADWIQFQAHGPARVRSLEQRRRTCPAPPTARNVIRSDRRS